MPYTGTVAAEPGLDYRTIDVEGFDNSAEVTIMDYSSDRFLISKKTERFQDLEEFFGEDRPSWSKGDGLRDLHWQQKLTKPYSDRVSALTQATCSWQY